FGSARTAATSSSAKRPPRCVPSAPIPRPTSRSRPRTTKSQPCERAAVLSAALFLCLFPRHLAVNGLHRLLQAHLFCKHGLPEHGEQVFLPPPAAHLLLPEVVAVGLGAVAQQSFLK